MFLTKKNPPKNRNRWRIFWLTVIAICFISVGVYAALKHSSTKTVNKEAIAVASSSSSNNAISYQSPIIQIETDSTLGQYLADANGLPLYTYSKDTAGVSSCTGSCLDEWPAYQPSGNTSLPTNVTIITRSDGLQQFAYKGMPLYYYIYDTEIDSINGDGVSGFQIAQP